MPNIANVRVDKVLTNIAVGYAPQNFIAEKIAPAVPVVELGGIYFEFGRESFKVRDTRRAIGGESNEIEWDVAQKPYAVRNYGLKSLLPDIVRDNADKPIDMQASTVLVVTEAMKLGYEKRIQAIAQDLATIANDGAGIAWDAANCDPEKNVRVAKELVRARIGKYPNRIMMNSTNRNNLVAFLKAKSQISYGESATVTDLPPILWGMVPVIPESVENTANLGQPAVISDVWGDDVLLYYVDPNPTVMTVSFMYTLRKTDKNFTVRRWRVEPREGEMFEVQLMQDEKLICVDAGQLITGTTT